MAIGSWGEYQRHGPTRELVKRWATRGLNVGIVTGHVSGLLVLDLDSQAALAEAERLGLPDTVTASTAKGRHFYFRHPGDMVKNRAGLFAGADIRGDGGYVVGPGSIHPSGMPYEWVASPLVMPLAAAPPWLMDALHPLAAPLPSQRPQAVRSASIRYEAGDCSPYGHAVLQREIEAICRALNGTQETTLNNAALKIGALVAGVTFSAPRLARNWCGRVCAWPTMRRAISGRLRLSLRRLNAPLPMGRRIPAQHLSRGRCRMGNCEPNPLIQPGCFSLNNRLNRGVACPRMGSNSRQALAFRSYRAQVVPLGWATSGTRRLPPRWIPHGRALAGG